MELPVCATSTWAGDSLEIEYEERRQQSIEDGHRKLMERTENIGNPEWRVTYLEEVPEH